jgi:DNA polymerase-3 subunit alpha
VGTVEVIVFPRVYEQVKDFLVKDQKVFAQGRVQAEDEKDAKLIAEKIRPFEGMPKEVWIRFETKEAYAEVSGELDEMLRKKPWDDQVVIYISSLKLLKRLPKSRNIMADPAMIEALKNRFGDKDVALK